MRSEDEYRQAIALTPNNATSHQWYANMLTAAGRFPEAVREMRRAQEVDPLSVVAIAAEGWVRFYARDYPAALQASQRALERNPDYALTYLWRSWAHEEMDSLGAAIDAQRRAIAISDSGTVFVAALARTLALAGRRAEAEGLLRQIQARRVGDGHASPYEIARVYEALGDPDQAFTWLERALAQRTHSMVLMRVDPQLDRLRSDPRFDPLVRRVFVGAPRN